mmetsp:Transcript_3366/g.4964  ORF Transcript_3366/g.4964 Transcript_3366/m.4964 type:complete len:205 (+) Transcript_3366:146-760(+)
MLNKQPLAPESAIPAYTVEDNDPTESTINTALSLDANSDDKMRDSVIGGAAIAGGVAGLAVCGPALGLVGAVGAGVLATQSNKAGDVARASGEFVVAAGDRAKKIDEEYHIVDKTKSATKNALQSAKKFDEKHHVVDKTKSATKSALQSAKKFDEKHHVVDKTKSATKSALQSAKKFDEKHHVGEKMSNGLKELAGKISPKKKE